MLTPRCVLLASHGTAGARAADETALTLCTPGAVLYHLTVVPDLWKGMMGDDWLNNASTRADFGRHVESELAREIEEHRRSLHPRFDARGVQYVVETRLGKPARCLIEFASGIVPDMVLMGSPRPKGEPGLHSRMEMEPLLRSLRSPLLIVPHPATRSSRWR